MPPHPSFHPYGMGREGEDVRSPPLKWRVNHGASLRDAFPTKWFFGKGSHFVVAQFNDSTNQQFNFPRPLIGTEE